MKIYQVDSFTNEMFKGNPAGVCILENPINEALMQNIALEMDISETAFLYKEKDYYSIRFFAPESEVNLCGHATLASSHILYESGMIPESEEIIFQSNNSILKTKKKNGKILMNFPVLEIKERNDYNTFIDATGIEPLEMYDTNDHWTLVVLKNQFDLINIKPDLNKLIQNGLGDIVVTSLSEDKNYDYLLRCFAPAVGISEDPATGSAQCALAPYWNMKTGKKEFKALQASKRTGIFTINFLGDRVEILGNAITIFEINVLI
ncbi:MAG TPA: PhzF family phenazine biosynthesis protein [Ignavibacteria bacterium]|nr:PhzF family phenazine biosynthesis protein [Ignavibacteria bacterium]